MEKEIKTYLNYVKNLSYTDLVSEGKKYMERILINAVTNKQTLSEINGKVQTFICQMYFASIADFQSDDKEVKFVATISKCSEKDIDDVFDEVRVGYYNMTLSEKAAFLNTLKQNTLRYFKTRDDIISLLKLAALLIAVDGKITFSEKKFLSNACEICENYVKIYS